MIKVGTLAKIRRLHLREGLSIKEIERRTGLARNTIRTWLRREEMSEPKYPARAVSTQLDPFKATLSGWLKTDTHRGKRDRRTIKAMFEDLLEQGYRGSYPTKNTLIGWVREYEQDRELRVGYVRSGQKYSDQHKQAAVQHYLDHDRCVSSTLRALGYPCRDLLNRWIDELHPEARYRMVGRAPNVGFA